MLSPCQNNYCQDESSYLPPNDDKFRNYEQLGLRVRSFARLRIHDRLNPRELAGILGINILNLDEIDGVSEEIKSILANSSQQWSGGATPLLPDGSRLVILNPWQSVERQAATLMEEICHIVLGHQHSHINAGNSQLIADDEPKESEAQRSYDQSIEEEAYAVGAAALVPFRSLSCDLSNGKSIKSIARHFGVTISLVKYRIKVLRLMPLLAENLSSHLPHKTHYRTQ